ncbi:hypothetical protein BJY52DRAFT_1102922, partial [Lactarius psammicola]
FQAVCHQITSVISNASQVFFPPAAEYDSDNEHAFVSSSEVSACSVEPGSTQDVGLILQILGKSRTPFGVRSGGHAINRGFSSTCGVRFLSPVSIASMSTLKLRRRAGPSLLWDDVYQRLDPYGVTVIGGRIPGVGVGGLILGGGYSFKTNEYGLAIDNVVAYELVLPNGTVTTVTSDNHDLWFALRGIVTKFTVKSHPQGQVWGGIILYGSDQLGAIKNATTEFSRGLSLSMLTASAEILTCLLGYPTIVLFYDSPQQPSGIFDTFLRIPNQQQDIKTRSYADFVKIQATLTTSPDGLRGHFCGFPTTNYSLTFLDAITDQVLYWGSQLTPLDQNVTIAAAAEPLDRSVFTHGTPSAYPPDRSRVSFPSVLSFSW